MKKQSLITALVAILAVTATIPAWSQVNVVAPVVTGGGGLTEGQITTLNTAIGNAISTFSGDLNAEINQYYNQPLLAQGIADSGAASTHIGTQRAFIDYQRFAVVVGFGFAGSLPGSDLSVIEKVTDQLEVGDLYVGAAMQPVAASFGFRPRFISDKLYVNAKLGYSDVPDGVIADGVTFNALSVGLLGNYQLIGPRSLPLGSIRWRGLALGSGVIYQRNELALELGFSEFTTDIDGTYALTVEPVITATATSNSVVIPMEVSTGVRVLWLLDLNFGAGLDLSFGSSDISLGVDSPLVLTGTGADLLEVTPGSVSVSEGTSGDGPAFVRPRLTGGFGLNLGPVKVDVPLMYYFDQEGNSFMAGVNVGFVW